MGPDGEHGSLFLLHAPGQGCWLVILRRCWHQSDLSSGNRVLLRYFKPCMVGAAQSAWAARLASTCSGSGWKEWRLRRAGPEAAFSALLAARRSRFRSLSSSFDSMLLAKSAYHQHMSCQPCLQGYMWCAEADSNSPSAGQKGNPHGQLQLGRDLGPVVGRYTSASATHAGWQLLQMISL